MPVKLLCQWNYRIVYAFVSILGKYKLVILQKIPDQFKMTLSTKWGSTPALVLYMVARAL